jgi:hypothetical protein
MIAPAVSVADADVRAEITRLTARVTKLRALIAAATEANHALRTARDYADSQRAGYIDTTGLEGP